VFAESLPTNGYICHKFEIYEYKTVKYETQNLVHLHILVNNLMPKMHLKNIQFEILTSLTTKSTINLGYYAGYFDISSPTFRRNILPPSSGAKSKQAACFFLVTCLIFESEDECSTFLRDWRKLPPEYTALPPRSKCRVFNVKSSGAYSNHCALNG
jgi:hypothetical protein